MSTQKTRSLFVGSIAVVLLLLGLVQPPRAEAVTYHETYISGWGATCPDGTSIGLLAECHLVSHVLTRPNGSLQAANAVHCQGRAVNLDTGTEYILNATVHYGFSFDPATFYPLTTIVLNHVTLISLGSEPNIELVFKNRIVVNANGEVANQIEFDSIECHG